MIRYVDYHGGPIQLTQKEISRASEDGYTIVTRPQADGGIMVTAVTALGVGSGKPWGNRVSIVDSKEDVPKAIKQELHLLGSSGMGAELAAAGRHRTAASSLPGDSARTLSVQEMKEMAGTDHNARLEELRGTKTSEDHMDRLKELEDFMEHDPKITQYRRQFNTLSEDIGHLSDR